MKPQTYTCQHCGANFVREANRGYKFCSRICFHISRKGQRLVKREMTVNSCKWCGEQFKSQESAGAKKNFCSRSCQAYWHSKKPVCLPLSPQDAAYIAGMLDGDGSITISDRTESRPRTSRPSVYVCITNSHEPLMHWLVEKTGTGTITAVAPSLNSIVKRNKAVYHWRLTSISALSLLQQVIPYMIEKREKAAEAMASQPLFEQFQHLPVHD